ncbi:MAG: hypothetical protein R3293_02675 [Candidatus Promineifilaceae bacterium]|nr:hypothetical protein [Candidatus Promineifilaceae bacterium]
MQNRSSIIGGLILILVGGLFLVLQIFPGLAEQFNLALFWPLIIVAVGVFFLLAAIFGAAPLAVPGTIVTGIGGLLFYQNATGNWGSWSFAWALIPGFVGLGLILMGLLDRESRSAIRSGFLLVIVSFILFAFFAGFLGGFSFVSNLWPILLIIAGIWILWRNRDGRGSKGSS